MELKAVNAKMYIHIINLFKNKVTHITYLFFHQLLLHHLLLCQLLILLAEHTCTVPPLVVLVHSYQSF